MDKICEEDILNPCHNVPIATREAEIKKLEKIVVSEESPPILFLLLKVRENNWKNPNFKKTGLLKI